MIGLKKNIGLGGRIQRGIVALFLLVGAYWKGSWILLIVGLFTCFEALFSWCILYQILGKNSCPINKK